MALLYPTDQVPLPDLARAALAVLGPGVVRVVTGAGQQIVEVPDSQASRVLAHAGLGGPPRPVAVLGSAAPGSVAVEGTPAAKEPEDEQSPGSGAPSGPSAQAKKKNAPKAEAAPPSPTTDEPPGPPAARPARRAKKTTARRTGTRRKEG